MNGARPAPHRLDTLRAALRRVRQAGDPLLTRPTTRTEKIGLLILVAVPMIFTAIALLPEITVPVPSLNDDALHFLFVQRASDALSSGQNPFDLWVPQIEAGFAQFFYYQPLPALAVVGLQRLSFGTLDLLTTFDLVRWILLVILPVTVFVSMRWMGFSVIASAFAAAASPLLSGNFRYGFEYESYTWAGFGLFTQLWAMHLSFLTVGAAYRALQQGKRLWLAALLFGLLVLTHLVYSYITAMAIGLIVLWGLRRSNFVVRVARLAAIGGFAAAISAWMWLPFFTQAAYLNATPYLQPEKYASYGAGPILGWLFSGELLDHARLPVLTLLLAMGVVAAVLSRARVALLALGLLAMWLITYFGPATLGVLANLFPLHASLLFHRFIGGVDLAAILLIGTGGALIWRVLRTNRAAWRAVAATAVCLLLLAPAIVERVSSYALNTQFMTRTSVALAADTDAQTILARLHNLPPGRVYAGLPATFGNDMAFGDLHFYNLLTYEGIESLPPPTESFSLNSDFIWDFDDQSAASFDLWNVRYMVAPTGLAVASFLTPILQTARYTLYQAPTTGYGEYVGISARRAVATQSELFTINLAWERSRTLPAERLFMRYDYPATVAGTDPMNTAPCPGGGRTDYETFSAGQIDLVVECPAASTLVIKTTYHPDWQITVDGKVVPDFMVSPSYIGISLPAGKHTVDAVYQANPLKVPLLFFGLLALIVLLLVHGRLDRWVGRLGPRPAGTAPVAALASAPETIGAPPETIESPSPVSEPLPAPAPDPPHAVEQERPPVAEAEPIVNEAPVVIIEAAEMAPAPTVGLPWFRRANFVDAVLVPAAVFDVALVALILLNAGRPALFDYFVPLASAFLHGQLGLDAAFSSLNELVRGSNGLFDVVYPPAPALILLPAVAIFGPAFEQAWASIILGAANIALICVVLREFPSTRLVRIVLSLVFGFGTIVWFSAQVGTAWHFALVCAMFFTLLTIIACLRNGPTALIGLFFAGAVLSSLSLLGATPFVVAYLVDRARRTQASGETWLVPLWRRPWVRRLVRLGLPALVAFAIPTALDLAYNAARFGSPFESGAGLIPSAIAGGQFGNGITSLANIPAQVQALLLSLPIQVPTAPFIVPPLVGPLSILLTTPVFLWAIRSRRRDWFGIGAWLSILAITVLLLVNGDAGGQEFGYRYALAFYPFLFILAVRGFGSRISWAAWTAIAIGAAVNVWGMSAVAFQWFA